MGTLAIPVQYNEKAVLLADDEPEHLDWLVDFLASLGLTVTVATNVEKAMAACQGLWYRLYVVDLNIPLGNWPQPTSDIFNQYPGFEIIKALRSQGNDGRRVIAYSAHSNEQITADIHRLYTDYVMKGRPIQLKDRIRDLLAQPDMTATALERVNVRAARRRAATQKRKQEQETSTKAGSAKKVLGARRKTAKSSPTSISETRKSQTKRAPSTSLTNVKKKADKQSEPPSSVTRIKNDSSSATATPKILKQRVKRGPGKLIAGFKGAASPDSKGKKNSS
jgi:CheY-like chemotaxis protein